MEPMPTILGRRVHHENSFVRYVEEDLHYPGLATPRTYYQLEAVSEAVIVVPLLADGRLLVERIYRHPHACWFTEWPAGGIDIGESVTAAAARELLEETGFAAASYRVSGMCSPLTGLCRSIAHIVIAEGAHPVAAPSLEDMELLRHECIDRAEAERQSVEGLSSGIFLIGLHYLRHAEESALAPR